MTTIAREHDEGVTPETLRDWQSHVEAWQRNHNYRPNPYAEPILGESTRNFIYVITKFWQVEVMLSCS
jgi:hypothetical protein